MFDLKIENLVLAKSITQLLEAVYGTDVCMNEEESNITFTDTIDLCGQELSKEKNIIFLSKGADDLGGAFDGIIHIHFPLKPADFIGKCAQIIKSITVPDLNKAIKIQWFTFNPSEFLLISKNDGSKTMLTEKERNILVLLYEAGDKAVSREAMLEKIWNYAPNLETHTLETHIYRLRQKIEKDPAQPKILVTEEKGYRLLV